MRLVCILLAVMSWTVESKNSVSGEGEWPYDIEVSYQNSYQKGDVRKDDVAVLTLGNLGGITVERIEVWVKSNKSEGAGEWTVTGDGKLMGSLAGTFKDWTGSYDNTASHPVVLVASPHNGIDQIEISLRGTANSLHIEKYVITYAPVPARTVTLMKGAEVYGTLKEESGYQGVVLPDLPDQGVWRFIGWVEWEFWTVYELSIYFAAGERFFPEEDCTLWAMYIYDPEETVYVTELVSGDYIYTNRQSEMALTGIPEDGRMNYAILDTSDPRQVYHVELAGQDTAYITHVQTGTPIGYSGTKMAVKASPWLVFHEGEETIFYTVISNKKYVLWLNVMDGNGNIYAGLQQTSNIEGSPMALRLPGAMMEEPAFTCHPECGLGVESIQHSAVSIQKVLRDGQIYIMYEGAMYDVRGRKVRIEN